MGQLVHSAMALAVAVGIVSAPAHSSSATTPPVDVIGFTVANVRVNASNFCEDQPLTVRYSYQPNTAIWLQPRISAPDGSMGSSSQIDEGVPDGQAATTYWVCPYQASELGSYTVGTTKVDWYNGGLSPASGAFTDPTSKQFIVKLDAQVFLNATRSGDRVRFSVKVRKFSTTWETWRPWGSKKVVIQRRKTDGTWSSIGYLLTRSDGTALGWITARAIRTYRARVVGTTTTWGYVTPGKSI